MTIYLPFFRALTAVAVSTAVRDGRALRRADLSGADLSGADLGGANLSRANLSGADLSGADLGGTCLDQAATIPPVSDDEIAESCLRIEGDRVVGWRTRRSMVVGSTIYEPGTTHRAPWFSVAATACHPGIYLAGREWLAAEYPGRPLVRVSCRRGDLHHAGGKWRAREIRVEGDENS